MDEQAMLDLARQLREHIRYDGNAEKFDNEIVQLITLVVDDCAKVVELTPMQLFAITDPKSLLGFIAAAVRGKL